MEKLFIVLLTSTALVGCGTSSQGPANTGLRIADLYLGEENESANIQQPQAARRNESADTPQPQAIRGNESDKKYVAYRSILMDQKEFNTETYDNDDIRAYLTQYVDASNWDENRGEIYLVDKNNPDELPTLLPSDMSYWDYAGKYLDVECSVDHCYEAITIVKTDAAYDVAVYMGVQEDVNGSYFYTGRGANPRNQTEDLGSDKTATYSGEGVGFQFEWDDEANANQGSSFEYDAILLVDFGNSRATHQARNIGRGYEVIQTEGWRNKPLPEEPQLYDDNITITSTGELKSGHVSGLIDDGYAFGSFVSDENIMAVFAVEREN